MSYQLTLEQFSGPMDKLLELIEKRSLEITEINLSQITEDFFAYLQTLVKAPRELEQTEGELLLAAEEHMRLLADFIVIASKLLLIKSKSLLPDLTLSPDEEESIHDLEERLRLYKSIKPAMKLFAQAWKDGRPQLSRPYFLQLGSPGSILGQDPSASSGQAIHFFYPGQTLSQQGLIGALQGILTQLEKLHHESVTIKEKIVSLEEEMGAVLARMQELKSTSFSHLSGARTRSEIVVMFLAILHLARDQSISLSQSEQFSDIMIRHESNQQPAAEPFRPLSSPEDSGGRSETSD